MFFDIYPTYGGGSMEVLISLKQNSIVEEYKLRLSYYQIELGACLILPH
jgi:hypothetical protein